MKKYINIKKILFIILTLCILILLFFNPFIHFKLEGQKEITIGLNENYTIPKVRAFFFKKDLSKNITINDQTNIEKTGTYTIEYKLKYYLTTKKFKIKVNVIDKEIPNIILTGKDKVVICPNSSYKEDGYQAFDSYDGDITNKVKINTYDTYIEYTVIDSSNNKFSIKRQLTKEDKQAPVITLKGNSEYTIKIGSTFTEPGFSAEDNCDGNITANVKITNKLNINKTGKYTIIYKVSDSSGNETSISRQIDVVSGNNNGYENIVSGPTYINGILIVNKKYSIPSSFGGNNSEATSALHELQAAAKLVGLNIPLVSGYRSYNTQKTIYNNYVKNYGQDEADTFSARPGHSEHQTGLAFDVGKIDDNYGNTPGGIWLKENAHYYGFIIRYLKGKEKITGYKYEPWHIRYVGKEHATKIYEKGITLEEYLEI